MTAMKKRLERTREYFAARPRLRRIAFVALILAMTAIQWLQLDLSCGTRVATVLRRSPVFIPVNMALLFLVDLVFLLFTRRWSVAYLAANVLTLIWSVADHYAWMFSGEPITVTTLFSAGTAMDVLAGYRLPFDLPVAAAIAAFLACPSWPSPPQRAPARKPTAAQSSPTRKPMKRPVCSVPAPIPCLLSLIRS